jgi:hypothetical protein
VLRELDTFGVKGLAGANHLLSAEALGSEATMLACGEAERSTANNADDI